MKKICVYCSSASDLPSDIKETALRLGRTIGEEKCALVYGGVNAGLMHCVAQGASDAGAPIYGIIPEMFLHRADKLCTNIITTADLNSRKSKMIEEADIFIVLPGGLGSIDEWISTASHIMAVRRSQPDYVRPIIVYNREGMYDNMIAQFAATNDSIFASGRVADAGTITSTEDQLMAALRQAINNLG